MSSAVSILGNSCTVGSAVNNGRSMHQENFTITARVVAPKRPNLPELSLKGIPHTDLHVREIVQRQLHTLRRDDHDICRKPDYHPEFLEDAYDRCRDICAEYAKTFYLGTRLMTEERQKAVWAIYVWCRRTDELVDGPNATHMSATVLDRWEERLEDLFNGRPFDMLDAALTDTVQKFPLDIKVRSTLYCYYVAGTVALMTVPVMGISPESSSHAPSIYNSALSLGIGNQLTNILRDVGEDALRGRVYLPQDELSQYGLCDEDVYSRRVTDNWREFMKGQINRARFYFDQAEEGASKLDKDSRWPVWSSLLLYRTILDAIEENDYDNLTKRAYVGRTKKLLMLPLSYTRSLSMSGFAFR